MWIAKNVLPNRTSLCYPEDGFLLISQELTKMYLRNVDSLRSNCYVKSDDQWQFQNSIYKPVKKLVKIVVDF